MRYCSRITLGPRIVARTPVHLGVNVELQDHHDRTNLWDWLADSGITVAREFHPETNLRRKNPSPGDWGDIRTREDFDRWRRGVLADPANARPGIHWDNFRFAEEVRWMGMPDAIVDKVRELEIIPLYSLGYAPKDFSRPLVKDVTYVGDVGNEQIDWEAAAGAYEYYFAVIHHYAVHHGGRYFMMLNEPENRMAGFHLPPEFEGINWSWWKKLSWDDEDPDGLGRKYFSLVATQCGVLARLARMAMDDVSAMLRPDDARAMRLSGPTNVLWQPLWRHASTYLDILDFHHYHPDLQTFADVYAAAEATVASAGEGKNLAVTEFNLNSGAIGIENNLFSLDNSLALAELLMKVLQLSAPGETDPVLELATLYLLHFPSTHRNYKHLLYGDMNMLDWTGQDRPAWGRAPQPDHPWYPTFEEQQVRFATPAYPMFRMLCRCVSHAPGGAKCGPHPVLSVGQFNPTSAGPRDVYTKLRVLAVQQEEQLLVTMLNTSDNPAANCALDLSLLSPKPLAYRWAVVRQTTKTDRDLVVAQHPVGADAAVNLDVPAKSLTQVLITPLALENAQPVELRERTITPGRVINGEGLNLFQTTRLRAIARIDAHEVDLTDLNVVWTSSNADLVRMDQGGLVQRMRKAPEKITLSAATLDGKTWPEVKI